MVDEAASGNQQYYIRVRGKITGPFAFKQLKSLRKQGRLGQTFEISTDRRNWQSAKSVTGLLEDGRRKQEQSQPIEVADLPTGVSRSAAQTSTDEWYYEDAGEQIGPVSFKKLKGLANSGQIKPEDFVWNKGYDDWFPAADVPQLYSARKSERHTSPSTTNTTSATLKQGIDDVSSGVMWTAVLNGIRNFFTAEFLDETSRALMRCGGYAMIAAMFVGPMFMAYVAVKQDSIRMLVIAGGAFFGLAVLKYLALRMATAVHHLVKASPSRLASPAFLDCAALIFLSLGLSTSVGLTLTAIQLDDFSYIVPVLQCLIVSGYAACICLQPEWLNIECPSDASGGEEGLGILSFLLKVLLRFAAVFFGVGAMLSTAGIVIGAIVFFATDQVDQQIVGISLATASGTMLVASALFPLVAYLWSSLCLILLDVMNSTLQVPRKLDQVTASSRSPSES